jgi:hypothetical protein
LGRSTQIGPGAWAHSAGGFAAAYAGEGSNRWPAVHCIIATNVAVVELASPQVDGRVLDVATGSSFVALRVTRRIGEKGKVIRVGFRPFYLHGLDLSGHSQSLTGIVAIDIIPKPAYTYPDVCPYAVGYC